MKSFKNWVANVLTLQLAFGTLYSRSENLIQASTTETETVETPTTTEYTLAQVIELYGDDWDETSLEDKIALLSQIAPLGPSEVPYSIDNVDDTFLSLAEFCQEGEEGYDDDFANSVVMSETSTETSTIEKVVDSSYYEYGGWERNDQIMNDGVAILRDTVVAWLFTEHDLHAEVGAVMLPVGQATIGDNQFAQVLRNEINKKLDTNMVESDFDFTKQILANLIIQWGPVFDLDMLDMIVSLLDTLCPTFMQETRTRHAMVSEIFYENAEEIAVDEPLEIPALA